MSHGEGGWENFRSRFSGRLITNAAKRSNALNSVKAWKQLARSNLNLFA